jgi:hypothetical protein
MAVIPMTSVDPDKPEHPCWLIWIYTGCHEIKVYIIHGVKG